jgi:hypothetical protein
MRFGLVAIGALALAGCSGGEGEGTSIQISGNSEDGNVHGAVVDGKSGKVKVDLPGFQGSFSLPKIQVTADNFDLNGVKLYPGTNIRGINVDAGDGADNDHVRISFDSPATAAAVRDYLRPRLSKAGYTLRAAADGLRGTTDEGKTFALSVKDAGAARSTGTITIG